VETILEYQKTVLKLLAGKLDGFYLAGGTALSNYHFQHHRESYDLDFFSKDYKPEKVKAIVAWIREKTWKEIIKIAEQKKNKKGFALHAHYDLLIDSENALRIDFVEDVHELLEPLMQVEGIPILSLVDIYLRKIYAVAGVVATTDEIGRRRAQGGRQTARDLFDLYHLSMRVEPLSSFAVKHCDDLQVEGLCNWFLSFDRAAMKTELADIRTRKPVEFREIDRHFAKEIDQLYGRLF
jgi:predicted nucleotidyltransferase component of viral defense system